MAYIAAVSIGLVLYALMCLLDISYLTKTKRLTLYSFELWALLSAPFALGFLIHYFFYYMPSPQLEDLYCGFIGYVCS